MKVKWGLIGCGDIARRNVAPAIHSCRDGELVSACRKNDSLRSQCQEDLKVKTVYTDWHELIAHDALDAI